MTLIKSASNTRLRSTPFHPDTGYSPFHSSLDTVGRTELNSAMGERLVNYRARDLGISFQRGIFSDEVIDLSANGGVILEINKMVSAKAENTGELAQLRSKRRADYQTGFETQAVFDATFTDYQGAAVVRQEIGLMGNLNGYFFSAVDGELAVSRRKAGIDIETFTQSNFNLDKIDGTGASGFKIDITKINVFRIQFGFMGNMPTVYEIYGGLKLGWIAIHFIDFINSFTEPEIDNPFLPIQIVSEVVSGTPNIPIIVSTNNWYAGSLTQSKTWADYNWFAANSSANISADMPIIALRNNSIFRSNPNFISAELSLISASTGFNGEGQIDVYSNPTTVGAIWNDVETDQSPMEFATNNFPITGGRYQGTIFIAQQSNVIVQFSVDEMRLNPSDVVVFLGKTTSSSIISLSARWGELR